MTAGVPYSVTAGNAPASASNLVLTVGTGLSGAQGVPAGDTVVVMVTANAGAITSVTDSQGNTYTPRVSNTAVTSKVFIYDAVSITGALVSGVDTITIDYSSASSSQNAIVRGCNGVTAADTATPNSASGTSAAPSVTTAASTSQAIEWAVCLQGNGNGGGAPASFTGGFTLIASEHNGTGQWGSAGDQVTSSVGSLTAGSSITSTNWSMAIATYEVTIPSTASALPPLPQAAYRRTPRRAVWAQAHGRNATFVSAPSQGRWVTPRLRPQIHGAYWRGTRPLALNAVKVNPPRQAPPVPRRTAARAALGNASGIGDGYYGANAPFTPLLLTNSFEGGTATSNITTGNSGGASGNAWDQVQGTVAGATPTYQTASAWHQSLGAQLVIAGSTGNSLLTWTTSLGTQTDVWFRAYVNLTQLPSATLRLVRVETSGNALCASIAVTTAGKIRMLNGAGSPVGTDSNTAMVAGAWYRLEGHFTGDPANGFIEWFLFTEPYETQATETQNASGVNTTGLISRLDFGNPSSSLNLTISLDDLGASNTGYLGPSVLAPPSQELEGVSPRDARQVHRALWLGTRPRTSNSTTVTTPAPRQELEGVSPRDIRQVHRAYWQGTRPFALNAVKVGAPRQELGITQRTAAQRTRAYTRGVITRTVNASPVFVPAPPQVIGVYQRDRRLVHGAVWHGNHTYIPPLGILGPRFLASVARRTASRVLWHGNTGAVPPQRIFPARIPQIPRRAAARAYWRGVLPPARDAVTVDAPQQPPTVWQRTTRPVRAFWHGIPSLARNAVAVPAPRPKPGVYQHPRQPLRGVQHGTAPHALNAVFVQAPREKPGVYPRRQPPTRAYIRAQRPYALNAVTVPAPGQKPGVYQRSTAQHPRVATYHRYGKNIGPNVVIASPPQFAWITHGAVMESWQFSTIETAWEFGRGQ